MSNTRSGAPSGAPARAWELYPDGHVEEAPERRERPVLHSVKFRHADDDTKVCDSELCTHEGRRIPEGAKYARVARIGVNRKAIIEVFHPACYDYEFDQGHAS